MHPTLLPPAGKLHQRTLTAANVCTTSSGRLFITDRISKQRYLVDTGSDLCVFPSKLLPGRMERTHYTLYAANGTTIRTYGWTLLNLNLGLRPNLKWRFVVAELELPIIGVTCYHTMDSSSTVETTAFSTVSHRCLHQALPHDHQSPV
jgi:hypothetical protein